MADLVVSAAGAAIGFVVGGPAGAQWGWALGSLIGSAFAPGQKTQGPRLDDLTVTGMAYGQPIPWIQATHRSAGQLIYSSDRREIATTVKQGKGGAKSQSTTYAYEVDCLFLIATNELEGMLRVWNNGKLAFTADASASDTSLVASTETDLWRRITFYGGGPTQLPDPTYEAAVGAGNAPAYRGMTTVFIEGLQLGQSGQMLNLSFEVGTNLSPDTLQNFQDFSGNNVPVTIALPSTPTLNRWGGCVESPAKFGAAGKFNGGNIVTPGDALRVFENDTFRLFPVDWSIRCWAYDTGDSDVTNNLLAFGSDDGLNEGLIVTRGNLGPGSKLRASYRGPATLDITSSLDHPRNEWFYFEITKSGAVARMFINGVLAGTQTGLSPDGADIYGRPGQFCIGSRYGFGVPWQGYIDDFVYESGGGNIVDYTPPTAPFEPGPQTLLYVPFYYADTVQRGYETIRTVVERLCARAGMPPGTYDASALDAITKPVRALAVSQVGGTRVTLELLGQMYFFQAICTDKIYFIPRAQSVVATIPYDSLGTAMPLAATPEPLKLTLRSDLEIPAQEAISYANLDDDYQADTQYSDRLLSEQVNTGTTEVPMAFLPTEAKAIADALVTDGAIGAWSTALSLPRQYAALTPGDSVLVEADDGSVYRMLLGRLDAGSGVMNFEARLEDPTVFTQAGVTGGNYSPQTEVVATPSTLLYVLDIPQLRDADDGVGLYLATRGRAAGWPGAEVFESTDDLAYVSRATVTESAVLGATLTALGDWEINNVFDEVSILSVSVGNATLSSVTRDQLLDSTALNAALVGNEVVQFRDATLDSPGVYMLSGFLRGRRGTERAMTGHAFVERFVLLQPPGMRRVSQGVADLGALRYFRGVSLGRSLASASAQQVINAGVSVKPFAGVNVRANRATTNTGITWDRRTRMETRFLGPLSSSVPLGERVEAYEVDIFSDNTFTTVVRTIVGTTPSVTYTSAQQVTDFGSNRTVLYVRIYQMSEAVGRGFPLQATI